MSLLEPSREDGQQMRGNRRDRSERQLAAAQVTVVFYPSFRVIHRGEDDGRRIQQLAARVGQLHASPEPIKEPLPQRPLQLGNLLAERRLRHEARLRGPAETTRLRHRDEVSELMHFHNQILSTS
jgi:hypothetical protein